MVRATFTPSGGGPTVQVELPVDRPTTENNNGPNGRLHDIREARVNIVVFRRPGVSLQYDFERLNSVNYRRNLRR